MKYKKGQSNANSAAITLIIITVVLILYILSLPPGDRAELLGQVNDSSAGPSPSSPQIFINENIGRLNFISARDINLDLQSFNLQTLTSAGVIASKNNMYVKNSLFDNIEDTIRFNLDMQTTSDLMLSFNAQGKGRLEIKLNDQRIFFGNIEANSPPIHLDRSLLQSQNTLTFSVTSPGIMFWTYNYYDIENFRILGDITDISGSTNTQTISLSEDQINFLNNARLRYHSTCTQATVSDMVIKVNSNTVFRGRPDCGVLNTIALSSNDLVPGVNFFDFELADGSVIIDQLRLILALNPPPNPLYIFEVDEKYFTADDELISSRKANVKLRFPNSDRKRMELIINGRILSVNVAQHEFERDISSYLVPGTNSIEVRTLQDVDIVQFRVELR